jgi:large subunit ribosomal protein L13
LTTPNPPLDFPILLAKALFDAKPEGFLSGQDPFMSTYFAKPGEIKAQWYVVDATDQVMGRLASKIAMVVQGKNKPTYTRQTDTGDFVIVLNAEKVRVTGKKADVIQHETYSRYPGGRHLYSFKTMKQLHPEKLFELAVRRMLPKSKMGRNILAKIKIYKGDKHPHSAQQPKELKLAL